jgi:hypothetical protein
MVRVYMCAFCAQNLSANGPRYEIEKWVILWHCPADRNSLARYKVRSRKGKSSVHFLHRISLQMGHMLLYSIRAALDTEQAK